MGRSAWDVVTDRLLWLDDGVEGLQGGLAGERYVCQACGEHLILKALVPTSEMSPSPYFAHGGGRRCSAPEREAQIDALTEVVITFRDTICAIPGVTATTELLGEDPGGPSGLGPVIIACYGETTIAIERPPTRLPGPDVLRRRIEAVRERHPGAAHVWFLKTDRAQFGKVGTQPVYLNGKKDKHDTVAPTEQQEAIVAAGGHVYWLDGKLVLIPYGIHHFRHPAKPGQDWTNWEKWRDPRDDWRISKPQPAADADSWGLVPVTLSSMTRTRAIFQPATAHQVMDELYTAQQKRHGWRNREAYAVYRERHRDPVLAPPTTPVTAAPLGVDSQVGAPLAVPAAVVEPVPEETSIPNITAAAAPRGRVPASQEARLTGRAEVTADSVYVNALAEEIAEAAPTPAVPPDPVLVPPRPTHAPIVGQQPTPPATEEELRAAKKSAGVGGWLRGLLSIRP